MHYREKLRLHGRPPNVLGELVSEGVCDEDLGERRRLSGVWWVFHFEDLEVDQGIDLDIGIFEGHVSMHQEIANTDAFDQA